MTDAPATATPHAPDDDPTDAELRRLSAVRSEMLDLHPFWGHLLLHVRFVPAPELPAFAATDAIHRIWFNPHHTRHLRHAQLGFVVAHELGHQLLDSTGRAAGRRPDVWNRAADYAINRLVAAVGRADFPSQPLYEPPNGTWPGLGEVRVLLDPRFDHLPAEAIYERLIAEAPPEGPSSFRVELPDGSPDAAPDDALAFDEVHDHGGGIDLHLPTSPDRHDRLELRERIREAAEASARSRNRGDTPAERTRDAHPARRSRIPWPALLRRYLGDALAREEYSLRRPDRRYLEHDLVVPGLAGERPDRIVVALDTSGSVPDDLLDAAVRELRALSEHVDHLTVLAADAAVHDVVPPDRLPAFLDRARVHGGGGTSHEPVFNYVRDRALQPDLLVAATDLRTRLPAEPPPYPVLWLVPDDHPEPPWGQAVPMPVEATPGPLPLRSRPDDRSVEPVRTSAHSPRGGSG